MMVIFSLDADTMENWDEKKLEEVVNKKHGEAEKKKAKTQIVSVCFCGGIRRLWVCDIDDINGI